MNNTRYWTERTLLQEQRVRNMGDKLLSNLEVEYKEAQKELQAQLDGWYQKYADENGLSIAQAKKKLNPKEQRMYEEQMEKLIGKAGDGVVDPGRRKQYIFSRINRLQALENQVAVQLELLGKSQDVETFKLLQRTYQDTYYRGLHVAGQAGLISRFDRLNPNMVEQICRTPWSGKSFSERIWGNTDKLIKEVRHILSNGAITGAGVDKMSRQLAKRMGVSYSRVENLIRTESAFVREQATGDIYTAAGLKQYEYMATLDKRTSQICRSLDNAVFAMTEKMVGVNYPPMHPRCRSTTVPYFNDEWTEGEQRFARDQNGKGIYVDAKMNYEQWHQTYINPKLTMNQEGAIMTYISSASYVLNEKLRNDTALLSEQQLLANDLDVALDKMKNHVGDVTRSVEFYDQSKLLAFMAEHKPNALIQYPAYTSSTIGSKYNPSAQVQMTIKSKTGKDITLYNSGEQEVLFKRNSQFKVIDAQDINGQFHIELEEV